MKRKLSLGDLKMDRKLMLSFILLVTIPLAVIGYYSSTKYANSIEETTIAYSMKMQQSMLVRTDDYIEDMVSISSIPAYMEGLNNQLVRSNNYYAERQSTDPTNSMPENFDQLLSIQRGIESQLSFINTIKRGANSVYLFDIYGNSYYSIFSGGVRSDLENSYKYWLQEAESSTGEAVILHTQKYISNLQSEKYAFSVVRKILDNSMSVIGLIAIDANISVIEDQIVELDQVTNGNSILVDDQGNVIYDSKKQWITSNISKSQLLSQAVAEKGYFYTSDENDLTSLHIYVTSDRTDWKVITSIPVNELMKDALLIRKIIWITTLIAVCISIVVAIILSFAITKPLRAMIRLMKKVQEGNFDVKFPVKYRDEVGMLGSQFNRMIVRLDQLIQDIYEMETKKNKAELQALQNQINPHFMYNTLESIRMSAEIHDDPTTADMIAVLGKLLRYSISDLNTETTLAQEMSHVQNYVELLNYRYPNRFNLVLHMDESIQQYRLIRLILQPIVENAIYHGLDDRKGQMNLTLSTYSDNAFLYISVKDDGVGMDPVQLDMLTQKINESSSSLKRLEHNGIGLRNVNERIKLQYGGQYGLIVSSEKGIGTEVTLRLPLKWG